MIHSIFTQWSTSKCNETMPYVANQHVLEKIGCEHCTPLLIIVQILNLLNADHKKIANLSSVNICNKENNHAKSYAKFGFFDKAK